MKRQDIDFFANMFVLASGVLWAFQPVFLLGLGLEKSDSAVGLLWINILGTSVVAFVISLARGGLPILIDFIKEGRSRLKFLAFLIADGVSVCLSYYFLIKSTEYVDPASAAVFYEAWPVIVALLLVLFSRDDKRSFPWLALGLFVVGYVILNLERLSKLLSDAEVSFALTMPLLAGAFMAVAVFLAQIFVRSERTHFGQGKGITNLVFCRAGVTALLLWVIFDPKEQVKLLLVDVVWIWAALGFGMLVTLSSVFFHLGASRASSNATSLLSLVAPVLAPLLLLAFGIAEINDRFLVGAAFIVTAIAMTLRKENFSPSFLVACGALLFFGSVIVLTRGTNAAGFYNYLDVIAILFGLIQTSQMVRVWDVASRLNGLGVEWSMLSRPGLRSQDTFAKKQAVLVQIRSLRINALEGSDAVLFSIIGIVAIVSAIAMRPSDLGGNLIAYVLSTTILFMNVQIWRLRISIVRFKPAKRRPAASFRYDLQSRLVSYVVLFLVFSMFCWGIWLRYE